MSSPLTASARVPTGPVKRARRPASIARSVALGVAGVIAVAGLWEGYKAVVPDDGVVISGARILPRTTDLAMPHVWEMVSRLFEPVTSAADAAPLWRVVADAALVSLGIAAVGWLVGTIVGLSLAVLMQRFAPAEWGLRPWIVLSQTVPLIAFAPVVRSWGSRIEIGGWQWPNWLSVAFIAAYLAFFPVAIGALRGLQSPDRVHTELMHTYAATSWGTMRKVRTPAAVPYLLPALRLGAAGAIVGTVVAEVSTGYLDGIGRLLVSYAGQASGDPSKAWAPIFGAIALGLVAAGFIAFLGALMRNYRRGEAK
jgi:NitT/TauT family transport system permease protein